VAKTPRNEFYTLKNVVKTKAEERRTKFVIFLHRYPRVWKFVVDWLVKDEEVYKDFDKQPDAGNEVAKLRAQYAPLCPLCREGHVDPSEAEVFIRLVVAQYLAVNKPPCDGS
jgi:hypothetical protein